jgi:hypothetical protein
MDSDYISVGEHDHRRPESALESLLYLSDFARRRVKGTLSASAYTASGQAEAGVRLITHRSGMKNTLSRHLTPSTL